MGDLYFFYGQSAIHVNISTFYSKLKDIGMRYSWKRNVMVIKIFTKKTIVKEMT